VNVPSFEFLAFAAVVAVAINVSSAAGWRRGVLLVANVLFFLSFTHDPVQLAPFVGFLALGFAAVKTVEKLKNHVVFVALIALLIVIFCWLKQYAFVPGGTFLQFAYMTVGMSYVFFRVMHLVIDSFQDSLPERIGLLSYVNYTLNFTSLVSGPIQLYPDYRRTESLQPLPLDLPVLGRALERIVLGFFKVSVLSALLFSAWQHSVGMLGIGANVAENAVYAGLVLAIYPLYLYINFAGYMDFVIGVAVFLRLNLPENFNRPFLSKGFIEFWGRWHMTLSNWLKAYVYNPLLLNLMRRFQSPKIEPYLGVFSYFVTFFLVGVWHGQTSMFVFFGLLQGLGVSVNKAYQILMIKYYGRSRYRDLCANPTYAACSRGLTFLYFAFAALWFWATWGQLGEILSKLGPATVALAMLLVFLGATIVLSAIVAVEDSKSLLSRAAKSALTSRYARAAWFAILLGLTLSVTAVLNAPAPHVVYKGF
jgi:alginate O-acetyltransferase complex protein AlgI